MTANYDLACEIARKLGDPLKEGDEFDAEQWGNIWGLVHARKRSLEYILRLIDKKKVKRG